MGMPTLLVVTLAVPIAMLLACLSQGLRERMPALLALAPVPGLVAALLAAGGPPLVLDEARLQLTLALDWPAALLLGAAALLWIAAGIYARTYLSGRPNGGSFAVWWLLSLTGSLGIFMAADMASFYVFFGMASLAAWGLVIHDGTPATLRAGAIYLGLAVLAEICLLMAFALLAAATPGSSLVIRDAVALLPMSPARHATLAFLIVGFGLKVGLVPLHVWLPLAYRAAPIPAAAVISGAISKAGIIGLIRFLPLDAALPGWGAALAAVGLLSAFYGVAVGITQTNPKTVLAYSSVSQMGFMAAVLGMALAAGDGGAGEAVAFYAAHHVLAKGALFLAVGVAATGARHLWPVLLPAAVVALGFGGLPLTGGYVAKLAVKAPLGEGVVGLLATLAGVASTLLMLHFLNRLRSSGASGGETAAPVGLAAPWLAMALAAVAIPWALFLTAGIGSLADALAATALWEALWPVLLGVLLAALLRHWDDRLPSVPEGDLVVAIERSGRWGSAWGEWFERAEGVLRRWPVAGVSLLALLLLLGAVMLVQTGDAYR
jgi:formate hydrogenlyase subunit 3/multisubunit Na+/H+ antiporter MnhD subunit